jgi:hypothetical protein
MLAELYPDPVLTGQHVNPGLTVFGFPAQTLAINLDTNDPIEEIRIILEMTIKSTITTLLADGVLNVLKRVRLQVNHPILGTIQPVDLSGAGVVELAGLESDNLDPATLMALLYNTSNTIQQGAKLRIVYRVSFPHPRFTDALRLATLLPVHLFDTSPTLFLDFGAATDICSGNADPFTAITCEIVPMRRVWQGDFQAYVTKKGFAPLDFFLPVTMQENALNVAAGLVASTEVRMQVPSPGRLASLVLRYYKGNAIMTKATIDDNSTPGSETVWELQQGRVPKRKFRNKHLQIDNSLGRPLQLPHAQAWYAGALSALGTGANTADGLTVNAPPLWVQAKQMFFPTGIGGALSAGQCIQDPSTVMLNFTGTTAREIYQSGAFFDVSAPVAKKQITEIVGKVLTPANQPSVIKLITRLYPDAMDRFAVPA